MELDLQAIGYPAVREAFNDVLQLCVERLGKSELKLAAKVLGLAEFGGIAASAPDILADTALYSPKPASSRTSSGSRVAGRRAIDRIVPRVPLERNPLQAHIAARLPTALFSVFVVERVHEEGGVLARDLLHDGPTIHIMDRALAAQVAILGEFPIAGRFVDLGPWHIGFGIVVPLRKSEAMAIRLGIVNEADSTQARAALHELVYPAHLHDLDLVMLALEPAITALAHAIDTGDLGIDDLATGLGALLPGKPTPKRKRKAPAP